jgi:hypothetical protein
MANKRLFYAVKAVSFSKCGENTFTAAHGVQSVGVNTRFNLDSVFEIGQISLYELSENLPDIECTLEKVLDGYPLIYHLATNGATSPSLSGRSNVKCTVGLSVYSDVQDSASGTPLAQCTMSGMYVSALNYNFQVNGPFTESVTLVGNNKVWNNTFTSPAFNNADASAAAEGVNRRQNLLLGSAGCKLPQDIPGISASGTNELSGQDYGAHLQSIRVSANLGREQLFELGRRGPYHRYVSFPLEVRCDIEVLTLEGDKVSALEDSANNLTNRTITIKTQEGSTFTLGTKNKLSAVNWGGGNAGQNGGNDTVTYSYQNFNDLSAQATHDPSGL